MPELKSGLGLVEVSPDNSKIAFTNQNGFYIYYLIDNNVLFFVHVNSNSLISYGLWTTKSRYFFVVDYYENYSIIDTHTWERRNIVFDCPNHFDPCSCFPSINWDNKLLFCGNPIFDDGKYKYVVLDIIQSFEQSRTVYEDLLINNKIGGFPSFPKNEDGYFITSIFDLDKSRNIGFSLYKNKIISDTVLFKLENSDWRISNINTYNARNHFYEIVLGSEEDVYFNLPVRHKYETESFSSIFYEDTDSNIIEKAIEARNASGLYRMDIDGDSLIQIGRDLTYYNGGISITGDGQYIYYGSVGKDTNSIIRRVNKYGYENEIVLNMGDLNPLSSKNVVNEDQYQLKNNNIQFLNKSFINKKLVIYNLK